MENMATSLTLFTLAVTVSPIKAYIECGNYICDDWSAYCCGGFADQCCNYSVYQFWWFWLLWLGIFLTVISCSCWCYRRRRYRRLQYVAVRDAYPPSYGTIVVSAPPSYPATDNQIGPTATAQPPTYQTSQEKPPPYVP